MTHASRGRLGASVQKQVPYGTPFWVRPHRPLAIPVDLRVALRRRSPTLDTLKRAHRTESGTTEAARPYHAARSSLAP
jgi:hypothetical protein